jgi:3-oxoacyl-[acyl-carrier-protein] synthase II
MQDKIVITGYQVWDSIGVDIENNLKVLLDTKTRSNFSIANDPADFEFFKNNNMKDFADAPFFFKAASYVANKAFAQSGILIDKNKIGLFGSTLFGTNDTQLQITDEFLKGKKRCTPYDFFYQHPETLTGVLSRLFEIRGISMSTSATCSSGIYSMQLASALLQSGVVDQILIVCADFPTHPFSTFKLNSLRALSKNNFSAPFDKNRNGLVLGDGIAAMVVELKSSAEKRGAKTLAQIQGIGISNVNIHPTNPAAGIESYTEAYQLAMQESGFSATDIDWISGHGTSTIEGDRVENEVMSALLSGKYITSFKGHVGHTMAATGLLDLIYTIEAMKNHVIPQIGNTQDIDLETTLKFATQNISHESRCVLKNTYGFGGKSSSVIITTL